MIATEFGIILELDKKRVYMEYEPEKYACVAIDDDLYIDDWWNELKKMQTYFGGMDKPAKGLCRDGITLIPPEELKHFEEVVKKDKRDEKISESRSNHISNSRYFYILWCFSANAVSYTGRFRAGVNGSCHDKTNL